jgi:hypothetical protein
MSVFGRILCVKTILFSSAFAFALPAYKTTELDGKEYEDMKQLVHQETQKCNRLATEAEFSGSSIEEADQFVGEDQSPQLVECLTKVSALILARRDQNDKTVQILFPKSLLEINQVHRDSAYKKIVEAAVADYKMVQQRISEADREARKKLIAELATAYEQIYNAMSELRPRLKNQKADTKPLFELVSKADITPPEELKVYRANRGGGYTIDLSERAEEILESVEQ